MTKALLLIITMAAISGCTPLTPKGCQKDSALDTCTWHHSGKVSDKDIFGMQASAIKRALDAALVPPHVWGGKKCNVHLDFTIEGILQNFIIKGGDKDYCYALAEAAKKAKFPPFPSQYVYDIMGSSRWDMQGQP